MLSALVACVALAAQAPSFGAWAKELGPPTKSAAETERVRNPDEPLLVYWMQTEADPLGVGVKLPGTLVANFDSKQPLDESTLRDFTFLAVATPEQMQALERALVAKKWVKGETTVKRDGGVFREITLVLDDNRVGTLSLRQPGKGKKAKGMADGRPSPSVILHVEPAPKR